MFHLSHLSENLQTDTPQFSLTQQVQNLILVVGYPNRILPADRAGSHQACQVSVQCVHSQRCAGLHHRCQLEALVVTDQTAHSICSHQNFCGSHTAAAHCQRNQRLGDNALQNRGQLRPDLVLGVWRTAVDDTVQGLRRTCGVQGGHDQVPVSAAVTAAEMVS